jgi:hypothetical protein
VNPKVKTVLIGAGEAFALGVVTAIPWNSPHDIVLSGAALAAVGLLALKSGIFYLLGFIRMNSRLWTPANEEPKSP